jgi:hypothetical protein
MRGDGAGDEDDAVEAAGLGGGAGAEEVAVVDWVEAAAETEPSHGRLPGGISNPPRVLEDGTALVIGPATCRRGVGRRATKNVDAAISVQFAA